MLRARWRIRARAPDAVDLDPDPDELTSAKAVPGGVRLERQGHAAGGLAADIEDPSPRVADGDLGADELQIAVDTVRSHEHVEQWGSEQTAGGGGG